MLKIKKILKIVLLNKSFSNKLYFLFIKAFKMYTNSNQNFICINKSSFQFYKRKYLFSTKNVLHPLLLNSFKEFDEFYAFYNFAKFDSFSSIFIQLDEYYILNKFNLINLFDVNNVQLKFYTFLLIISKMLKIYFKIFYEKKYAF